MVPLASLHPETPGDNLEELYIKECKFQCTGGNMPADEKKGVIAMSMNTRLCHVVARFAKHLPHEVKDRSTKLREVSRGEHDLDLW